MEEEILLGGLESEEESLEKLENTVIKIVDDPNLDSKQKAATAIQNVERYLFLSESYFSGPMPSPKMMAEYNKIIPNCAERILKMTEEQHRHRISLEKEVIPKQVKQSGRGQIFAFILCLMLTLFAGYCVHEGDNRTALAVVALTIISIAGIFITGKYMIKEDLKKKSTEDNL